MSKEKRKVTLVVEISLGESYYPAGAMEITKVFNVSSNQGDCKPTQYEFNLMWCELMALLGATLKTPHGRLVVGGKCQDLTPEEAANLDNDEWRGDDTITLTNPEAN